MRNFIVKRKLLLAAVTVVSMGILAGCEGEGLAVSAPAEEGATITETPTIVEEVIQEIEETETVVEEGNFDIDSLVGLYEDTVSQRAGAEVLSNGNGTVYISVSWGSSAFESYVWTMNAHYDSATGNLLYTDEKCVLRTFSENGDSTDEVIYKDKAGYFEIENGKLKWTGAADKESGCTDCIFEKYSDSEIVFEEGEEFMPSNFLESRVGKDVFSSYDEIIDSLEDGEGYAYLDIEGYDGKLIGITEATYDDLDGNLASIEISIYADNNGKVTCIGNSYSQGTAYPLRCDDGILYCCGGHTYEEMVISKETGGLMVKKLVNESYDDDNNPYYSGFEREDNSLNAVQKDITIETFEEFQALFDATESKRVINFVVIGM